jgi:hypothetical protein
MIPLPCRWRSKRIAAWPDQFAIRLAPLQDSVALVRKERRRCRSLELQAGGSATNSERQGVGGTGDSEGARWSSFSYEHAEQHDWCFEFLRRG